MKKVTVLSVIFIISLLTSCGSVLDAKIDFEYLEEDLEEIEESGEISLQELALLRYAISVIPLKMEAFVRENIHLPTKELEKKVLSPYDDMTYRDILEEALKGDFFK